MSWPCPVCQEEAALAQRGPREVTIGTVAVLLERVPVVACAGSHEATPPEVIDAVMVQAEQTLPRARSRLFRGDACTSCGSALIMPVRRTVRGVSVKVPNGPVLTLRFDLPVTRCPDCGTDQVPSRSQEDLVVSVPAVFARGAPPPGT